jgi:mycothiol synthase
MSITTYPYHSAVDLHKIQAATAEWIALAGFHGSINVSDIALRLFNGMRKYNSSEIVSLWEDTDKGIVGWAMVYPAWSSYEAQFHPDYRQHKLTVDVLDWAEQEATNWIRKLKPDNQAIQLDIFDGDTALTPLLEQRGYVRGEQWKAISVRSLDEPIPAPQLPDGFSIRSVQSEQELDKLVAHINDSFGWSWTVEAYQQVVRSPSYQLENEMVVVAPDGRFAASCILLLDIHNRMGMFENVGTGSNFRRLGLAKALLYAGMHRMKTQGFTIAMVPHIIEPGAAPALYASVGFQPTYKIYHYTRQVI